MAQDVGQDDSALQDFIHGRRDHLFRSAFLLCGNRDEAEDLVQSTLLKVVLAWRRLERIDSVEAYARRTLVNVFIGSRRRMWRREQPYGDVPEHAAPEPDVDAALAVQAALARLPIKQRTVLVLRFWEDLSAEATADLLGMRPGTVRSHSSRGIAALRAFVPRGIGQLQGEEA
jgi:RNA polymerase sigma-70 factor (sigma-E family)